jgi:hypothetical protein
LNNIVARPAGAASAETAEVSELEGGMKRITTSMTSMTRAGDVHHTQEHKEGGAK